MSLFQARNPDVDLLVDAHVFGHLVGGGRRGQDHIVVGQLGRSLEQARVSVEDIAGIRLAAGRAAEQERHLAIGNGLFGQVVIDAKRRPALLVHEVFGHRAARVGRDVLQRRGIAGAGRHHDRIVHGAVAAEDIDKSRRGGFFLGDRHVNADDARSLLVQDRVDGDRGLARLAVADDQLALAAADGDHGVDGLDARLQRLIDGLPAGDAGRR